MSDPRMNAAKCLICGDIVESRHLHEHAFCKCGNVSVCGGLINPMIRGTNYSQVGSVDSDGQHVEGEHDDQEKEHSAQRNQDITRHNALYELESLLASIHNLPPHALNAPVTHRDYSAFISRVLAILRAF